MREAIGGSWLFQIVIAFVLLFTGYMCLSINSSKAFNVKNEIIRAIEREGGSDLANPQDDPAIQKIVEYLKKISYRTEGTCPESKTGDIIQYFGYDRNGNLNSTSNNSAFCIAKVEIGNDGELPDMSYYRVIVFYQLDLPLFNQMFSFRVTGDTRKINTSYSRKTVKLEGGLCQIYNGNKKVGHPQSCDRFRKDEINIVE